MKCTHCDKEFKPWDNVEYTAPDGDPFHPACIKPYEKERNHFFNNILPNDTLFAGWLGVPESQVKTPKK